jgi:hypothetical protein
MELNQLPCSGAHRGFIPVSEAVARLADGMWGGLPRPIAVRDIKLQDSKASVGFGLWRESAAQHLRSAALKGSLPIYCASPDHHPIKLPAAHALARNSCPRRAARSSVPRQLVCENKAR